MNLSKNVCLEEGILINSLSKIFNNESSRRRVFRRVRKLTIIPGIFVPCCVLMVFANAQVEVGNTRGETEVSKVVDPIDPADLADDPERQVDVLLVIAKARHADGEFKAAGQILGTAE